MSSFSKIFNSHRVPGDPESTAESVADAIRLNKTQRAVLMTLLVGTCTNHERHFIASIESDVFERTGSRVVLNSAGRLLTESFAIDGAGRRVTWGEATVDDHYMRIAFLQGLQLSIQQTIDRHQSAIDLIEAEGVTNLNEIELAA